MTDAQWDDPRELVVDRDRVYELRQGRMNGRSARLTPPPYQTLSCPRGHGVELVMWLVARGAMSERLPNELHTAHIESRRHDRLLYPGMLAPGHAVVNSPVQHSYSARSATIGSTTSHVAPAQTRPAR
jgi:hypothetical protein